MDVPMRDDDVPEDGEEDELADETSTPGSSTLEVEKPYSDVEDYMMENHNDGTGQGDTSMATSSSSRMVSTNCPRHAHLPNRHRSVTCAQMTYQSLREHHDTKVNDFDSNTFDMQAKDLDSKDNDSDDSVMEELRRRELRARHPERVDPEEILQGWGLTADERQRPQLTSLAEQMVIHWARELRQQRDEAIEMATLEP